ncbi:hypothetical protein PCL_12085 [Purpureocillium lilacinum]|uniref:Uncharacterized protein n=1 Tax=Purpureocillium lilacinum TaxID=33203 RepID=A0A2U3DPJ9_PURLI|nr:hypothetical protein PCL_12085 [Purpureocillium lilacinum]
MQVLDLRPTTPPTSPGSRIATSEEDTLLHHLPRVAHRSNQDVAWLPAVPTMALRFETDFDANSQPSLEASAYKSRARS